MRLLVTRAQAQARSFAEEVTALGHEPIPCPMLEFRALNFNPQPFVDAESVIATSANALKALVLQGDPAHVVDKPLHVVGRKTAKTAMRLGFKQILNVKPTASDLANSIPACHKPGDRLAYAAATDRAFDMKAALSSAGVVCETVAVYTMRAAGHIDTVVQEKIKRGAVDGVIVMSQRTAAIFSLLCVQVAIQEEARRLTYFCLSPKVAIGLDGLGPKDVRIARLPNRRSLLDLLRRP